MLIQKNLKLNKNLKNNSFKDIKLIKWNKKTVTKQDIEPLCKKYNIENKLSDPTLSQILASILVRRNITEGSDLLYYFEKDLRFQHNPFILSNMEDAVDRILSAQEEGEKVLVFGDSDVDGITSTAILYNYLKKIGMDVEYRLSQKDEEFGLNTKVIEEFASNMGSLIITVDCGIKNFESVDYANSLGLDVIVTDHHNPQGGLPNAVAIINPKLPDTNYPVENISGAAVSYKLVSALRFSKSDFYKSDICILDIREEKEEACYYIDCLKTRNLLKKKILHEKIIPNETSISQTKLPYFLSGQYIYVWDKEKISLLLKQLFGSGVEFNLCDLKDGAASINPKLASFSSKDLLKHSQIAKYYEEENTQLSALFNIFVTYVQKNNKSINQNLYEDEKNDIQLVALAALADIMPMKNENRIFVKNGIDNIKKNGPCQGLAELIAKMRINPACINSGDLSWTLIPAINSAGRLGKQDLAIKLLLSEDARERNNLAQEIFLLNEERKNCVKNSLDLIWPETEKSFNEHDKKLCVIYDERINPGITGLLAQKLMGQFNVPSIIITKQDEECIGSIRSCRGLNAPDFLESFGDFFLNYGGHNEAAGFSFNKEKLSDFLQHIKDSLASINLGEETQTIQIDAEIPPNFLLPAIFELLELFEPYGCENQELTFMTSQISICDAMIVGKKEPYHLKLTLDNGKYKFPAMFWGQGDRLKKDIFIGKKIDILYNLSKNYFNGQECPQLIIKDIIN